MPEEKTEQVSKKSNSALLADAYIDSIKSQIGEGENATVDYMTDAKSVTYKDGLYLKRMNGYPVDPNHILNEFNLNTAIRANDFEFSQMITFDEMKKTKGMSLVEGKSKSVVSVWVPAGVFKQDENKRNILDAQGKSIPVMNSNGFQKTYIKKVALFNPSQTKGAEVSEKFKIADSEPKKLNISFLNSKLEELGSSVVLSDDSSSSDISKSVYDSVRQAVSSKDDNAEANSEETQLIAELACIALFKQAKIPFALEYTQEQIINKEAFIKFDLKYDNELEAEIDGVKTPKDVLLNSLSKSKQVIKDIGSIQPLAKKIPNKKQPSDDKVSEKKVVNSAIPF